MLRLKIIPLLLLLSMASNVTSASALRGTWEDAFKLVPADALALVITPSMKQLSDQLANALEGMDRAEILTGGRPMDLIKSSVGFVSHVDDTQPFAIVWLPGEAEIEQHFAVVIPVTDAQGFIEGNLQPTETQDQFLTVSGVPVYAQPLDNQVIIAQQTAALAHFVDAQPVDWSQKLSHDAIATLSQGDLAMVITSAGLAAQRKAGWNWLPVRGNDVLWGALLNPPHHHEVMFHGLAIDFDPLGIVFRAVTGFDPAGELGHRLQQKPAHAVALDRLPAKGFYLAWSVGGGFVESATLAATIGTAVPDHIEQWLNEITEAQFAIYPTPGGIAAGLLNEAVFIAEGESSADMQRAWRQLIEQQITLGGENARTEMAWQPDHAIEDLNDVTRMTWEIVEPPPRYPQIMTVQSLLFGQAGWRSLIHTSDDALMMTFSERPGVLLNLVAVNQGEARSLADHPMIKALRDWLPQHCDAIALFDVARIEQFVTEAMGAFGQSAPDNPQFEAGAEPIAIGIDIRDHAVATVAVVPARVAAGLYDLTVDFAQQMQFEQQQPEQSDSADQLR